MTSLRSALDAATARPVRTLSVVAVVLLTAVGGFVTWQLTSAAPGSTNDTDRVVAAADRDTVRVLDELSVQLRGGLRSQVNVPDGVVSRYTGVDGDAVTGTFALLGQDETCYVLRFSATGDWLATGKSSGVKVVGPRPGDRAACDPAPEEPVADADAPATTPSVP